MHLRTFRTEPWVPQRFVSKAEIVAVYDATIADACASLEAASEETFQ